MNENVQFKVVGKPESDFESGSIEIPHNRASYIYQHQQHYTPTNPPTHQPMNHHLPKVQHGLPTQQPNPTQPTRLPIFPIYAQAAKTAEKSENSDGGLVQNLTRFFNHPAFAVLDFESLRSGMRTSEVQDGEDVDALLRPDLVGTGHSGIFSRGA